MSDVTLIAGLYPYVRDGKRSPPRNVLREIEESLTINQWYRNNLTVLAGDEESGAFLERQGLKIARTFDDAPNFVRANTAHLMKHWMCRWAAQEFGEFIWVDWDTVMLREPNDEFWSWCRHSGTPKFVKIPDYWATVNCGVYYGNKDWLKAMDRSFENDYSEPNDELLWASVLPSDVATRPEFWWGERVVHVEREEHISLVSRDTYLVHTKDLGWADRMRTAQGASEG